MATCSWKARSSESNGLHDLLLYHRYIDTFGSKRHVNGIEAFGASEYCFRYDSNGDYGPDESFQHDRNDGICLFNHVYCIMLWTVVYVLNYCIYVTSNHC